MNIASQKRVFGLDVLRAAAILIVVDAHSGVALGSFHRGGLLHQFMPDGVELFFVLSGFLIGGILIRTYEQENRMNGSLILNFWTRRWFRTLPNYYFVLILLIVLNLLRAWQSGLPNTLPVKRNLASYFVFLQNFVHYVPDFFPETWSLAIEEWSYITIPLLLLLWDKFRPASWSRQNVVLAVILTVILGTNLLRLVLALQHPINDGELGFRGIVLTRLDAIAYGILAAYTKQYYPAFWNSPLARQNAFWFGLTMTILTAFTASVLVLATYVDAGIFSEYVFYKRTLYFSVIGLSMMLLIPRMDAWRTASGLIPRAITHISLISYSLYLLNLSPIMVLLIEQIPTISLAVGYAKVALFWVVCIGLSTLLYKYYELPMTTLRDRLSKREPHLTETVSSNDRLQ
ncbi:MAG: acyltransferase [Rudanella sp.]|nr:acyltransferase [Rudanella sp.]